MLKRLSLGRSQLQNVVKAQKFLIKQKIVYLVRVVVSYAISLEVLIESPCEHQLAIFHKRFIMPVARTVQ